MSKKWLFITVAAVVMSACSNTGLKPEVTSSVPTKENTPSQPQPSSNETPLESLSFRVTTTSKAITPFDQANGLVESSTPITTDDSAMSYTFDRTGAVNTVRIDPYDDKGQLTRSAYLMDFARDTYQVLDKTTQTYKNALEGSKTTLSQMVDKSALQKGSNAMSALTLSAFASEAGKTGFSISARSKNKVSYARRSREKQGDVLTTLTFDPNTQLLAKADTITDSDKYTSRGTFDFSYQTIGGKQFLRMVNSLTTTEMKDKQSFGKITMPSARVLKPGETLKLKPGEYIASQFSSPLRPGENDTSSYTYQTTTEYRDVRYN